MNVLFPIETISRELDYKLILAYELAGVNDRRIHFGSFKFLDRLLPYFKGGLYVGKTIFRNDARRYKPKGYYQQKQRDIDSIYYYEEGGFFYNDEERWKEQLEFSCNPKVFDDNDYIFVWGEKQRGVLAEKASYPGNVKTIGVVRFDLYQNFRFLYAKKSSHRKDDRKYVLINTHNGFSNNHNTFIKFTNFFNFSNLSIAGRSEFLKKYNYDVNNLYNIVQLVLFLAEKLPEIDFVIRPHPSENLEYYTILFRNINNVRIRREGSVGEWLSEATAMIHAGCTTSFEAHFSGVPVITFIKEINEYSIYPANSIGFITKSEQDVLHILDLLLKDKKPAESNYHYEVGGIEVINNLNEPAINLFLDEFKKIENNYIKRKQTFWAPSRFDITKLFLRDWIFQKAYYYGNLVLGRTEKLNSIKYNKNKFPGFNKDYIMGVIGALEKERGKKVRVTFYNQNYFVVE